VADLATALVDRWGSGRWTTPSATGGDVEAKTLRIAIDKAVTTLGWQPRWHLRETVRRTVEWYRAYYRDPEDSTRRHTLADIDAYMAEGSPPGNA